MIRATTLAKLLPCGMVNSEFDDSHFAKPKGHQIEAATRKKGPGRSTLPVSADLP